MLSKRLSRLNYAFENLTDNVVSNSKVSNGNITSVDVNDYVDIDDNISILQKAVLLQTKAINEVSIHIETIKQLEEVVNKNSKKIEEENVTANDVMFANEAWLKACSILGGERPNLVSFESISNNALESLKIANEGIGETISKGFKTLIEWIKNFFSSIWNFIKSLFSNESSKVKEIEKISESLKDDVNTIGDNNLSEVVINAHTEEHTKEEVDKLLTNLSMSIKLIGLITDNKISNTNDIVKYISNMNSKVKEYVSVDIHEHSAVIEYNAKSIFLCLKSADSDTVEHTLEKINSTSSGVKPAFTGITKDLDRLYSNVDKKHFKPVFDYCSEVEVSDKNSTYTIDQAFDINRHNGVIVVSEKFHVLVNNYTIVNDRIKAHSKNFTIDTDVVKTELLIKAEDLDTTILNNKEIIKNMSSVMLENSRILEDYNKKLRECIETGVRKLDEVVKEIERDENSTSIKNKLDLTSVLGLIKNCSYSVVNIKNQLSNYITSSLTLGHEFNKYVKAIVKTIDSSESKIEQYLIYKNDNIKVYKTTDDVVNTKNIGNLSEPNSFQQLEEWKNHDELYTIFINSSKPYKENSEAIENYKKSNENKVSN